MNSNNVTTEGVEYECPICMDAVDRRKNCIVTECGHCFHAKCMMTNVQRNGFGCPMCRHEMVEDEDDEDYEEEEEEEDDDGEELNDYALRGMRWLFQRVEGEELDDFEEDEEPDQDPFVPSSAMVTQRLIESGITMEQLVKCLLIDHGEYDSVGGEYYRISDETYSLIRHVIVDLTEEEANASEEEEREAARFNNEVEEDLRIDEQNARDEEEDRKRESERNNEERMREGASHERKSEEELRMEEELDNEEEIMLMAWNDGRSEEKAEERARRRAEEEDMMAQEDDDRYLDMFDDTFDENNNWVDNDELNWAWNHRYEGGLIGIDI